MHNTIAGMNQIKVNIGERGFNVLLDCLSNENEEKLVDLFEMETLI